MILSPEFKEKLGKFRRNKRSFYSLIILATLFILTLPAELLFNDRPIILKVDSNYYFPVFKDYTFKDFGGSRNVPVNYRSSMFQDFLDGKDPVVDTQAMFPAEDKNFDVENPFTELETPASTDLVTHNVGEKRDSWALWPLVPHSYKSSYTSDILNKQRLANPFGQTVSGVNIPGAIEERHFLGTDKLGKDVLARLVYGFRMSLIFGFALAITSTLLGCIIGGIQGFFGGLTDLFGQRLIEVWGALPRLMLLMILSDFLSRQNIAGEFQHIMMLFIIMNLTSWMGMAAHMRAQFLKARNLDYVRAAKALGVSDSRIMARHILPNSLVPIITFLPFSVSSGILALVGLDYLGFGLKYPAPSLGDLLSQGQQHLSAWWIMVPTFLTLTTMMILLTFVGDGVRNAFDPRHK